MRTAAGHATEVSVAVFLALRAEFGADNVDFYEDDSRRIGVAHDDGKMTDVIVAPIPVPEEQAP